MKIEVNEQSDIVLKDVYNAIILETNSGESIGICMRDSGFEFNYMGVQYEAKEGHISCVGVPFSPVTKESYEGSKKDMFELDEIGHMPTREDLVDKFDRNEFARTDNCVCAREGCNNAATQFWLCPDHFEEL